MDEQNRLARLLGLAEYLWSRKKIVALCTLAGAVAGFVYGMVAKPVYVARAVIFPKEVANNLERSPLGGNFTSALNPLAGVGQLTRLELILKGNELARRVISDGEFLPELFPDEWDARKRAWKDPSRAPSLRQGAGQLAGQLEVKVNTYKMTIGLNVRAQDSALAFRLAMGYLQALNERTKEAVIREAEANREFLESQLNRTSDPWIREKIQEMAVRQIEAGMLLNANAFEVLVNPEIPRQRESPKRLKIVLVFALAGFLAAMFGVMFMRGLKHLKAGLIALRT